MNRTETNILQTRDLEIGYDSRDRTVVASGLNLELTAGQLTGLLGPNGSGKSTLIRTLARMHAPLGGQVRLNGEDLQQMHPAEVAKQISTVLTDRVTIGNLTVYSLVAFGRSPYTGMLGSLSDEDRKVVRWAIEAAGLADFVDRDIARLSDGERQKVMIARALAQDTPVILLDEPTAHLDLPNRVEIIRLLRKLAGDTGKTILMSTHELDLALKACDQVWLMNSGQGLEAGVPEDLVLDGTFERVFQRDSFDFDRRTGSFTLHPRQGGRPIALTGDPIACFWTARALEREGFQVVHPEGEGPAADEKAFSSIQCICNPSHRGYEYLIEREGEVIHTSCSIRDLVHYLRERSEV